MVSASQAGVLRSRMPALQASRAFIRHKLARLFWLVIRPKSLGVRALVIDDAGRALLVRHTYDRLWYLPGGGVARFEGAGAAIARELEEEVGLKLPNVERILGVYHSKAEGKDDHVVVFVVRVTQTEMGMFRATDAQEIAAVVVAPLDDLPEGTSPATRRRVSEYLVGATGAGGW